MSKKTIWRLCCILTILVLILTFTPVFTPDGKIEPRLFGMPYTLWMGLLQSIILIVLTAIGAWSHPGRREDEISSNHA